jgi:hypothetical protein
MRVREVRSLRRRSLALRWDVLPFGLLYTVLVAVGSFLLLSTQLSSSDYAEAAPERIDSAEIGEGELAELLSDT